MHFESTFFASHVFLRFVCIHEAYNKCYYAAGTSYSTYHFYCIQNEMRFFIEFWSFDIERNFTWESFSLRVSVDTIPLHLFGSLSFFIELYVFLWIMKTFSAFPVVLLLWWLCEYAIFFSLFRYVVGAIFSIRFESNVAPVATAVATIVSSIRAYFCISFVDSLHLHISINVLLLGFPWFFFHSIYITC